MNKESPILFNGAMVRAILEGRKTQTRRPVKIPEGHHINVITMLDEHRGERPSFISCGVEFTASCVVGDTLWVRETWRPASTEDGHECFAYAADNRYQCGKPAGDFPAKWKPSIHMPRRAARTFLDVTGVRVERVSDISESDAMAEGFDGRRHFLDTWTELYHDWRCDTWVWVIDFKRRGEA